MMKRTRRLSIAITSGLMAAALLMPATARAATTEHSATSTQTGTVQICIDPNNPIWDDGVCIP